LTITGRQLVTKLETMQLRLPYAMAQGWKRGLSHSLILQ
jgi:hypothetical protein